MGQPANRNYAFAESFVDELARSRLRHVCICPGSRSTPLALSFAQSPGVKTWVHLDERSAAFFALGMARALGETVALVCTSGTAAANFLPAVVEAHYSQVPLLVLTADRPAELLDWGATQTIDQSRLYGSHSKWFVNMPTPEVTPDLLRYVRATACRAMAVATESPAGVVHVNFPFREPLEPEPVLADLPEKTFETAEEALRGRDGLQTYLEVRRGRRTVNEEQVLSIAASLHGVERGLIVCGPQYDAEFPGAVSALTSHLGFPILADPLSQTRCGPHNRSLVIDNYDAFLRDDTVASALKPEVILRFGAIPTSKVLLTYLQRHRSARQVMVHDGRWHNPIHAAAEIVCADASRFARDLTSAAKDNPRAAWPQQWLTVADITRQAIHGQLENMKELFEGKVLSVLSSLLPPKATVFAGNSMPVRDMDTFFPGVSQQVRFMANRGASGIDGVVSSALGASAVLSDPLVLVLGDISMYHDMNGLLAAKQHKLNATIIVINNDGGGIFSFLPQAKYPEHFERYFGTPHGLTFEAAASMYGLAYSKVTSWEEFHQAVSQSIMARGTSLIEVPGQRARNVQLHSRIWSAVAQALGSRVMGRA